MDNVQYRFAIQNMTEDDVKLMIRSGDDSKDNQIRVTKEGLVYLSQVVGNCSLDGLKFRFETFDANNKYVGPTAANDSHYIERLYLALKQGWESKNISYLDIW